MKVLIVSDLSAKNKAYSLNHLLIKFKIYLRLFLKVMDQIIINMNF